MLRSCGLLRATHSGLLSPWTDRRFFLDPLSLVLVRNEWEGHVAASGGPVTREGPTPPFFLSCPSPGVLPVVVTCSGI